MSAAVFERYSAYYDLLYRDKNYAAEARYVVEQLRRHQPGVRTVLELGSGTGKHGRLLAGHGLDVTGVERSESMVEVARSVPVAGPGSFRCETGDVRAARLDRSFDAVLSLFHVVSYQTSNADVLAAFHTAARHLEPGGVFLFDVWHGPAVLHLRPTTRVKRVQDEHWRLVRIAEPHLDTNASTVRVHYTIFAAPAAGGDYETIEEQHHMRYFFPVEMDLLAREAGFEVDHSEEFGTGAPVSENTWGVAYLLRKNA